MGVGDGGSEAGVEAVRWGWRMEAVRQGWRL